MVNFILEIFHLEPNVVSHGHLSLEAGQIWKFSIHLSERTDSLPSAHSSAAELGTFGIFEFLNNKKWFFFIKLATYFCTSPI